MKICRFETRDGRRAYGLVEEGHIIPLARPPFGQDDSAPTFERTGERLPLTDVRLLAPSVPSKIVGVGLNYRAHADEMKKPMPARPLLFLKPPTAALDPGMPIVLPHESSEVHYEAELAVVIGRTARRVTPREARECTLGFTCFVDVTARDIQRAEVQYTRAKGFDTFAPFGPWIETDLDPTKLAIKGSVNGTVKQRSNVSDMIFDAYELIAFASRGMTLLPGDVLTTGTPPGVGPLVAGDIFEVEIEGIGVLRNPVRREAEAAPSR